MEWIQLLYNEEGLRQLVGQLGLGLLALIIFAETGLLAGFFLPGDSLLVTAGVFTIANGDRPALLDPWMTIAVLTAAAIIGDSTGRWFGSRFGETMRKRPDSWWFKRRHLEAAESYYREKGGPSIVIARYIPILRTFVPFAAGMGGIAPSRFMFWNVLGALLWVPPLILLGRLVGGSPLAEKLHHVILAVIILSILPLVVAVFRRWRRG
ncbi:MAG: DedA family protein [Opitutia bacterium]|jgi:membrane-associated protein